MKSTAVRFCPPLVTAHIEPEVGNDGRDFQLLPIPPETLLKPLEPETP